MAHLVKQLLFDLEKFLVLLPFSRHNHMSTCRYVNTNHYITLCWLTLVRNYFSWQHYEIASGIIFGRYIHCIEFRFMILFAKNIVIYAMASLITRTRLFVQQFSFPNTTEDIKAFTLLVYVRRIDHWPMDCLVKGPALPTAFLWNDAAKYYKSLSLWK